MDILIKNMEMPRKCYSECPFCDDRGDYPRCIITGTQKGYLFIVKDIRMEDCPLVALPEHGDLKDETDIIHRIEKFADADLVQDIIGEILASPTIVEASNEGIG